VIFALKSFVATKPIKPLHHIVDNPLFDTLFYLFCSLACFQSLRRERIAGEFPRHQLRRHRAAANGIRRQVSLTHVVPIFLYLSIGLHAGSY
jgi:hypothetical protein